MHRDVLAIVLAGGRGTRLEPLTRDRAKPAVPFGGIYRIIDFTLSNCLNSDVRKILILTQYKAVSLNRHIDQGWKFLCRELDEYIEVIPPQQRIAEMWYQGTADAIYQNVYTIEKAAPRDTLILAGDHIYKMNYAEMIAFHRERRADLTIACLPVPRAQASDFGVIDVDSAGRVLSFLEKPKNPPGMPGNPDMSLASMGIYVFATDVMYELLFQDAAKKEASSHDFGKDIIPGMLADSRVFAYPFRDENRKQAAYWRDVGTLDAFFQTNMDLIQIDPILNLYDRNWPIHTYQPPMPPPKFVHTDPDRRGAALNSIVCQGAIVSGGQVYRSILSPGVRINSYALIEDSILFENVEVGRHARIRKAIIDKDVKVPPGFDIGWNRAADLARGLTVTEDGVTVVAKGEDLERFMPMGG
ncbi:glucose-1-phosphate adenylyltransferase [Singulisphaera acidiphila]|uniref:Glucose-1-phosphate adenylyltransferase n=1 Tax=Singulisphaera acidiphila (strain ATCC BAA-1392 / DSM 18658 / VKM B-2454 / MOB10) TaxID=886293 RepID=L0D640_SINAD|nr:glucose-1-phosphate adenylyltransferase [Singulisphaera acidiphila]AGA24727.1 glucose-1-phosphate adenylyltransferase [Singulisphaera acidiphila DSM 18658]